MAELLGVRIPTQDSLACSKENRRGVVQRPRAPVSQQLASVCLPHPNHQRGRFSLRKKLISEAVAQDFRGK